MKKFILNSFYNVLVWIIPVIIMFISVPMFMKYLGNEVYGIYLLLNSIISLLSIINLGTADSVIKYVAEFPSNNSKNIIDIINNAFLLNFITSIIFAFIILISKNIIIIKFLKVNNNSYYNDIIILLSLILVISLFTGNFISFFKAIQSYRIIMIISTINNLVINIGIILLVMSGYKLKGILVYNLFICMLNFLVYYYLLKKNLNNYRLKLQYNKIIFNNIFNFSKFSFLNAVCSIFIFNSDKLFIGYFFNTSMVTLYTIPSNLSMKLQGFFGAALNNIFPKVSEISSSKDIQKLKLYYVKLTKYTVLALILICIPACFYSFKLLTYWVGVQTAEKTYVLLIISFISYTLLSLTVLPYYYFNGLGLPKYNFYVSFIGGISAILFNLLLIYKFNLIGAAIATLLSSLLSCMYSLYKAHILLLKPKYDRIVVKDIILIIFYSFICYVLNNFVTNLLSLIFICFINLIIYLFIIMRFNFLDKEEKLFILRRVNYVK